MNWYLQVLKNYAIFSGRARRKEYWMFVLFNIIFAFVAVILDIVFETTVIYFLYFLAVLIPWLAVTVRRLHDIGKSGWMILIVLIPIAGAIWLIVLLCLEGVAEVNEYGVNSKEKKPNIMAQEGPLRYCTKCSNQKMDINQGLLCNLSGLKPSFETKCPDFKTMNHFTTNEFTSNKRFIHLYSGISKDELDKEIDKILLSSGYKLKKGIIGNGTYAKGSIVLRLLFGAFSKYFIFDILTESNNSDGLKAIVTEKSGGVLGGLPGVYQVKNEFKRLSLLMESI